MKLFIFSDLNIVSTKVIFKKSFPEIDEVSFSQIKGLAWEESLSILRSLNFNQSDTVLFWFSRANLLGGQILTEEKKKVDESIIEKVYRKAQKNLSYLMNLGLEVIFINPSNSFVTSNEFKLQINLEKYARLWDYFGYQLLEKDGIKIIYETDLLEFNHFSNRLWYSAKNPFSFEYLRCICSKVINLIQIRKYPIKVLAFDLDDTIWGGVIGEDGIEGIRLGGHDLKGELFQDIQRVIINAKSQGLLIGVLSKNNIEDALSVFNEHNEMLIKENDLDFIYCNWEEKYLNIIKASKKLNLSLENFAFLDNSHVERASMANAFANVNIINLPLDEFQWASYLSLFLNSFKETTQEDQLRNNYYKLENLRKKEITNFEIKNISNKDINKILEISIKEEEFDIKRIEQLFSRTNQFNLSTRRLNSKQILDYKEKINKFIRSFRVSDKFGDYGICAVYCSEIINNKLNITDLAISCRALGRGVEEYVFNDIKHLSKNKNLHEIEFKYIATKKNKPIYEFLLKKGLSLDNLKLEIN